MFKNRLTILCIGCLCLTFCLPSILNSQTKQGYKIAWSTLNSGGNTEEATSASYRLKDAIGQPVVGEASSENYSASSGFWAAPQVQQIVGVEEMQEARSTRQETRLMQNYPNPFTERTSIQYTVASRQRKDKNITTDYCLLTTLKIYDLTGRLVKTFDLTNNSKGSDGQSPINQVVWDGRDQAGQRAAPGVYFYKFEVHTGLETGGYKNTKKMILVR